MLLADYRMPEMNGIEFLEAGHGPVPARPPGRCSPRTPTPTPRSRRSTSSTSTTTCSSRGTRRRRSSTRWSTRCSRRGARSTGSRRGEIRVVGHRWSAPSFAVRDFLARNLVPVPLVPRRRPGGAAAARRRPAPTDDDVPVVVTADGTALLDADRGRARRSASGLTTTPATDFYDLIVVGGGPAGLGAAVYGGVGGAAHRARRAAGHRRPGRAEHPDRELPRLPGRRVRRPAHRPGPPAGAEVRRRGAHRPRRGRPGGARLGPGGAVRRRHARSPRTRSCSPPACPTGRSTRPGSPT